MLSSKTGLRSVALEVELCSSLLFDGSFPRGCSNGPFSTFWAFPKSRWPPSLLTDPVLLVLLLCTVGLLSLGLLSSVSMVAGDPPKL